MQTEHLCDDVYYQTIHVILKVWEKLVDSLLYHTINVFPKRDSPALIVHTATYFLHITVHIFQKIMKHPCNSVITDVFCVTIHTISLSPHILDVNNKCSLAGELQINLWGKGLSLDILVPQQHTLYLSLQMPHRAKV
jgi:hypothetical protein